MSIGGPVDTTVHHHTSDEWLGGVGMDDRA